MDQASSKKLKQFSKDEKSYDQLKAMYEELEQKAERAEQSLELLEAAIRTDYDSILITELNLEKPGPRIVYVNDGFIRMTGYSREEVLGKTPRILQGPKTDRATLDRLKMSLKEGKAFFGQAVNYRKDGSEFIMQWDIHPLTDEEGNITHWVSYQHDITERKRAEEQVVDSNIEFDDLDEESKRTLVDMDEQGNIVMANKSFRELVGYDKEELKKVKAWDLLPRKFHNSLKGRFDDVMNEEDFDGKTYRIIVLHKSGVPIQVEINTKLMRLKEQTLIRGDIRNITLQKRILRTLSKRNADFARVFRQISDFHYKMVLDEDKKPRFSYLSENFPEVTGFMTETFTKKDAWKKLIHPDDLDRFSKFIANAFGGQSTTEEYRIVNKDGEYLQVLDYAKPVRNEQSGEIEAIRGSVELKVQEQVQA